MELCPDKRLSADVGFEESATYLLTISSMQNLLEWSGWLTNLKCLKSNYKTVLRLPATTVSRPYLHPVNPSWS